MSCPICQHQTATKQFEQGQFTVKKCTQCGCYWLDPRPQTLDELLALYPDDYQGFLEPLYQMPPSFGRWLMHRHYQYRADLVQTMLPKGGYLLDVGCGTGNFLSLFTHNPQWHLMGTDVNQQAVSLAQGQGLMIHQGTLETIPVASQSFDAITLWEVIEHVPDPVQTIAQVHRLLKSNGVFIFSTPNADSWQARFWQKYWQGWDVPVHLQLFTRSSITPLLHEAGLKVVGERPFADEHYYFVQSFQTWYQAQWGHPPTQRLLAGIKLLSWPLLKPVNYHRSRSSLVMVAQKQ